MKKIFSFISFIFIFCCYFLYAENNVKPIFADKLVGDYIRTDDKANIELTLNSDNQFYIKGFTSFEGNVGELDYILIYDEKRNILKYESEDYSLIIIAESENALCIKEEGFNQLAGEGTSFEGTYIKSDS